MSKRRSLHPSNETSEKEKDGTGQGVSENAKHYNDDVKPYSVEPLNPLSWLAIPWHLGMVVFYALLLYHGTKLMNDNHHIFDPERRIPGLGGRFKYLTHINLWVQLGFFIFQLLADIVPKPLEKNCKKVADLLFTTTAFPLATLVAGVFWGLYAIDRRLIYPEAFDLFVPTYMNHFWHTTILLWVLCEIFLVYHHFPITGTAAVFICIYGSCYIGWVVYVFVQTKWWVYPFMKVLPLYGMALFFGSSLFLVLGLYLLGKMISYTRWGMVTQID